MFVGPNPPGDAMITYYLQKRHIFGDMRLRGARFGREARAALPTSKRRGLSRVAWSMRLAAAADSARRHRRRSRLGPRFLPGTLHREAGGGGLGRTRLPLRVVPTHASTHTTADRKAQYALALKLYDMLGEMTTVVDRMNDVRRSARRPARRA